MEEELYDLGPKHEICTTKWGCIKIVGPLDLSDCYLICPQPIQLRLTDPHSRSDGDLSRVAQASQNGPHTDFLNFDLVSSPSPVEPIVHASHSGTLIGFWVPWDKLEEASLALRDDGWLFEGGVSSQDRNPMEYYNSEM